MKLDLVEKQSNHYIIWEDEVFYIPVLSFSLEVRPTYAVAYIRGTGCSHRGLAPNDIGCHPQKARDCH